MSHNQIIKRIPGELAPSRKENQGFIDDLGSKTQIELRDILERQNKLLANKSFISKLSDKGEKMSRLREKLLTELSHRDGVEQAANLLSRLNIASEGRDAMNELEWTGRYNHKSSNEKIVELDSADEEEDPLQILAQPTGTGVHKKKIINLPPEETLINEQDRTEIESFNTEEHVNYIVQKVEKGEHTNRESFKPYKTTKTNVHDPMQEKLRKKNKHWEVTAATPPLIVHGAVKPLGLNESLELQTNQAEKLREVQANHAIQRLTQTLGMYTVGEVPKGEAYRSEKNDEGESSGSETDEEHEVRDEEDNDKAGTVVFTVDAMHE